MYSAVFILVIERWLFILLRLFESVWEFAQQSTVLCGLGEGIRLQSLGCPVNGALELLAILPLSKGS